MGIFISAERHFKFSLYFYKFPRAKIILILKILSTIYFWTIKKTLKFFSVGEHNLKLKYAAITDQGTFECQVSTNPKINKIYRLYVVGKTYMNPKCP